MSFNEGENWQKLQLNLPVVPVTDLTIQDNDLIAATAGRAFWILDDLSAIQQAGSLDKNSKTRLFKPKNTIKLDAPSVPEPIPGLGQNPSTGLILDYFLPENMDSSKVVIEITDLSGKKIRTLDNQKDKAFVKYEGGPAEKQVIPSKKGLNRTSWDLRKESAVGISKVFVNGDYRGALVAPNTFKIKLIAGKDTSFSEAVVLPDPRLKATAADFEAQEKFLSQIESNVADIHQSVINMRKVKAQLESYMTLLKEKKEFAEIQDQGKGILKKINDWENNLISSKQETFQDVINFPNRLNAEFLDLKSRADSHNPALTLGAKTRLHDLQQEWNKQKDNLNKIIKEEIARFNDLYKQKALPALILEK